jgi:hypothetical protein
VYTEIGNNMALVYGNLGVGNFSFSGSKWQAMEGLGFRVFFFGSPI